MKKNFSILANEWFLQKIPTTLVKHRVLKTDPVYKFVINADIYLRSNITQEIDDDTLQNYYDLSNIITTKDIVFTGDRWLSHIQEKYNLTLASGTNFFSSNFPELGFANLEDKNLFDIIYLSTFAIEVPENFQGINVLLDFSIQSSEGFIRNKLFLDTNDIKPWLTKNLSFNWLISVMEKSYDRGDYKVKDEYKSIFGLNSTEVYLLETMFKYNSALMPTIASNNKFDINRFWYLLDLYGSMTTIDERADIFGFTINNVNITNIENKDFKAEILNDTLKVNTKLIFDNNSIYYAK